MLTLTLINNRSWFMEHRRRRSINPCSCHLIQSLIKYWQETAPPIDYFVGTEVPTKTQFDHSLNTTFLKLVFSALGLAFLIPLSHMEAWQPSLTLLPCRSRSYQCRIMVVFPVWNKSRRWHRMTLASCSGTPIVHPLALNTVHRSGGSVAESALASHS